MQSIKNDHLLYPRSVSFDASGYLYLITELATMNL